MRSGYDSQIGIVQNNSDNQLVIVTESSRFKTLSFISGIYLKYLMCKCLTLHRCILLMMLIDPILIVLTGLTLIPILQIDGTKIDIQIILALLKIAILLVNFKFMQGMVCHQKFKKNAKRLYGTRMFIILVIALQDFVVIYRKYHMIDQTKPDVIVGTETWLSPDIKDHEVFPGKLYCLLIYWFSTFL